MVRIKEKIDNFLFRIGGLTYFLARHPLDTLQRLRWVCNSIPKDRPCKILDIGCGSGIFSFFLAKKGHTIIMIDKEERSEKLNYRAEVINNKFGDRVSFKGSDIRFFDFSNFGSDFDYIICTEVIEHILDDNRLVNNISNVLKKGGMLLLTTPYKYYKRLLYDRVSSKEDGGHVRYGYDLNDLKEICESNGLSIVWNGFLLGYLSQKIFNLQRFLSRKIGGEIADFFLYPLRLIVLFDSWVTRMKKYPYLSIAIKAEKRD